MCQAALLLCGISIMAFTAVEGYKGYIVFVWSYGIFLGGYQYCLKMYIYEKVRARNFARALGFAQSSTAIPTLVSIPLLSKYLSISIQLLGGKYLVFESSRSVKMRGFSFLSLHAF